MIQRTTAGLTSRGLADEGQRNAARCTLPNVHPPARELIDLHIHVGAAVAPHILWSIAHQQGFKLPVKDYWEFVELISASSQKVHSLQGYLPILPTVTAKIQSSPAPPPGAAYE